MTILGNMKIFYLSNPFFEVLRNSELVAKVLTEGEIQEIVTGKEHIKMGALIAEQLVPQ